MDWAACVELAKKHNPELTAAAERIRQAEQDRKSAGSGRLPSLSGSVDGGRSDSEGAEGADSYSVSVSARQILFDAGRTGSEVKQADEQVTEQNYSYDITSADVLLGLRSRFIELLRAEHLVKMTEEILERRRQAMELIRLRYEAGREHRGSQLTAEAKYEQASFDLLQASRSVALARTRLQKELGIELKAGFSVRGILDVPAVKESKPDFDNIAQSTPYLQQLQSRTRIAELENKSAKAEFFPEIYASADAGRRESEWPPGEDAWSVGVSMSFPIFEGGRLRAGAEKAESGYREAVESERSGKDDVITTLHSAWNEYRNAVDRVKVRQKFYTAGRERARISEVQYSNGLLSFDDWIIIEDDFVNAEKALLNAKADALISRAQWIYAKGGTLEDEKTE